MDHRDRVRVGVRYRMALWRGRHLMTDAFDPFDPDQHSEALEGHHTVASFFSRIHVFHTDRMEKLFRLEPEEDKVPHPDLREGEEFFTNVSDRGYEVYGMRYSQAEVIAWYKSVYPSFRICNKAYDTKGRHYEGAVACFVGKDEPKPWRFFGIRDA
jgi:hypothetical protein